MGMIYSLGPIGNSKKCIAIFEEGYVKDERKNIIGKYDDRSIYDGSLYPNNYIGRISFNYGYVSGSNNIFVKATKYGELISDSFEKLYFEGEEGGAIAAFIVCYKCGMIRRKDSYHNQQTSISNYSTDTNDNMPTGKASSGDIPIGVGANIDGIGCVAIIVLILVVIGIIYASLRLWGEFFVSLASGDGKKLLEDWICFLIIMTGVTGVIIDIYKEHKNILQTHLTVFIVAISITTIVGIFAEGLISIIIVPIGMAALSWPVFVLAVIVSYIIAKTK